MGVEVAGSELPKANGDVITKLPDLNGKINFDNVVAFGDEEVPSTGEASDVSKASIPKNAVDEWPEELKIHEFYFVKLRYYDDPSLKAEFEQAEKTIQKKNEIINQLYEDLNTKKLEKSELFNELNALKDENSQHWDYIKDRREKMKPLQTALGSLRGSGGERGSGLCSTEEDLNQLIRSIEYRMQHESMSLKEEKQLMKEIKELEATRPKVIAHSAKRAEIQESLGKKEVLQDQVKLLGTGLDGVRKQQELIKAKRDRLSPQLDAVKKQIEDVKAELQKFKSQRDAAYDTKSQIKKQRDEGNKYANEIKTIFIKAQEMAAKKDVKALEEFNNIEIEKFMSQWNSNKAFRDDYEKKNLISMDYRQLSRDGRIRNVDEKPLVRVEPPKTSETDVAPKATSKPQKEAVKTTLKTENLPVEKVQKELKKGTKELKTVEAPEEDDFIIEKPKKSVSNDNEIDAETLKEMKKEEEKEKQRQALERKKKLQDKAAAKAALRIQKEAERKQKEREKKLRKKGGSIVQPTNEEEPAEISESDEPKKSDDVEEVIETPVLFKAKVQQESSLRNRKPIKTRGTLPKAILKKKKSDKYWLWGSVAAAAVLSALLLLVLGYKYLF